MRTQRTVRTVRTAAARRLRKHRLHTHVCTRHGLRITHTHTTREIRTCDNYNGPQWQRRRRRLLCVQRVTACHRKKHDAVAVAHDTVAESVYTQLSCGITHPYTQHTQTKVTHHRTAYRSTALLVVTITPAVASDDVSALDVCCADEVSVSVFVVVAVAVVSLLSVTAAAVVSLCAL
jgi:hypothetical protein